MALITTTYLDQPGLQTYDNLIKAWSNSENQIAYKTVAKSADGNSILFFKKPNAVVGTDTPDKTIALGNSDMQAQLDALANIAGATWDSVNKTYSIALDDTFGANTDTIVKALNELKAQINVLNGTDQESGSVAKSIKDAIETLDTTEFSLAEVNNNVVTIHGISETDGKIAVGTTAAKNIVLEEVAYTGAAEDVSTTAITDGAETEPKTLVPAGTAQGALEKIARDLNKLTDESKVTVEKLATAETGYLASYVVKQNNAQVGATINIPKDFLVKSASVKTVETADVPYSGAKVGDKYIDFEINVKDGAAETTTHIYIAVNDLVHPISGDTTTVANEYELQVSVDATNKITATLNNIYAQKVQYVPTSATTVLTGVTTVKGGLDKIDTLIQGMDADLDATTDSTITDTEKVAVVTGVTEVDGKITAIDSIDADKAGAATRAKEAVIGTSSDTATANTVWGAKAYADNKVADLDGSAGIATVSGDTITIKGGISEADGVISNSTADDIAISKISSEFINGLFSASSSNNG